MERLARAMADRLAGDLERYRDNGRLPPLRALCAGYGVSRGTMAQAVHLLAQRGLLTLQTGRPAWVGQPRIPRLPSGRADNLLQYLRDKLTSGEWQPPLALPKIASLGREWHVANRTVMETYQRLVEEQLVHRKGRQFFAGLDMSHRTAFPDLQPVLLVVGKHEHAWKALSANPRNAPFTLVFIREAEAARIRLIPAVAATKALPGEFLTGPADALAFARSLGPLYQGSLIIGPRRDFPGVDHWAHALERLGPPVVWFDAGDEGFLAPRPRRAIRLHSSEAGMARAALDFLAARGHRRIAYVYEGRQAWEMKRLLNLKEIASRLVPSLSLSGYRTWHKEAWLAPVRSGLYAALERLRKSTALDVNAAFAFFLSERASLIHRYPFPEAFPEGRDRSHALAGLVAASLSRLARIPAGEDEAYGYRHAGRIWSALAVGPALEAGATAFLAPNDSYADSHYKHWFKDLDLKIPRDVSLLSFDNADRFSFDNFSSVDSGFARLGYRAFQLFLRDAPPIESRKKDVPAEPWVVDRGSVGGAADDARQRSSMESIMANRKRHGKSIDT